MTKNDSDCGYNVCVCVHAMTGQINRHFDDNSFSINALQTCVSFAFMFVCFFVAIRPSCYICVVEGTLLTIYTLCLLQYTNMGCRR